MAPNIALLIGARANCPVIWNTRTEGLCRAKAKERQVRNLKIDFFTNLLFFSFRPLRTWRLCGKYSGYSFASFAFFAANAPILVGCGFAATLSPLRVGLGKTIGLEDLRRPWLEVLIAFPRHCR